MEEELFVEFVREKVDKDIADKDSEGRAQYLALMIIRAYYCATKMGLEGERINDEVNFTMYCVEDRLTDEEIARGREIYFDLLEQYFDESELEEE